MAIDEAILIACGRGEVPPTLRLYAWSTPCLSIGYFQNASTEVKLEECNRLGIGCVRRLTGGRAVLHDRELTYSVIIPASHPFAVRGILNSYRSLSRGLAAGIATLGVHVETTPEGAYRLGRIAQGSTKASPPAASSACFNAFSDFELTVQGRKLVGSAQTRKRGAVLQHGTILMDFDPAKIVVVLMTGEASEDRFAEQLKIRVISLREALGREVGYEEVAEAIKVGFEQTLGITLDRGELTPSESSLAAKLREGKYLNADWTLRR